MPRHARLDAEGVLHHIIVRGIEQQLIFRDNTDKNRFVERMGKIFTDTQTHCYAWASLSNHVHLFCKTGRVTFSTLASLSRAFPLFPTSCGGVVYSKKE